MNRKEAIKVLKKYQKWRLGTEQYQFQEPKVITEAINLTISQLESNHEMISEIENAMERWHLARDNDNETVETINLIMKDAGYLEWHNKSK